MFIDSKVSSKTNFEEEAKALVHVNLREGLFEFSLFPHRNKREVHSEQASIKHGLGLTLEAYLNKSVGV